MRLEIQKTYRDPESYFTDGCELVFSRSLSIPRNQVVLPRGFELVGCDVPSQVRTEPDGRLAISFLNAGPAAVPLTLRARPLPRGEQSVLGWGSGPAPEEGQVGEAPELSAPRPPPPDYDFPERALQSREIVYFLQPPETHSFRLYHDFTETRPGRDHYLNVVRSGSTVTDPSAVDLDSGEALPVETLRGEEISAAGIDVGRAVEPDTEVVVVRYEPVPSGGSRRLRIEETYTDPSRYGLLGDQLVWNRRFGRTHNALVLPAGWHLTDCSIPASITETGDGRIRLDLLNARPDRIVVIVKSRRRALPLPATDGGIKEKLPAPLEVRDLGLDRDGSLWVLGDAGLHVWHEHGFCPAEGIPTIGLDEDTALHGSGGGLWWALRH